MNISIYTLATTTMLKMLAIKNKNQRSPTAERIWGSVTSARSSSAPVSSVHRFARSRNREQQGYTRTEIMLVVAVFALLGAVIIPNVSFPTLHTPGIEGARKTELRQIETAMQAMMAGNAVTSIDANDPSTEGKGVNSWSLYPTGASDVEPLASYLFTATTTFYYCFNGDGRITEVLNGPATCSLR